MNTIPNRQAICEELLDCAREDKDIVVLCSDSRGSASLGPFFERFPEQSIEVGIAEQNLVSISAGLARCGKKPFAASPASFLSTRSMEQVKVDVCYSYTNVKLIGISGGVSYGALGMTHHSTQDIAAMASLPGLRVYLPSDRFQARRLIRELLKDEKPAYIRTGRNPVPDVYSEDACPFELDRATALREGGDVLLIACGEMVHPCIEAAERLAAVGVAAGILDMYCVKPLDREAILSRAAGIRGIVTVEEHSMYGGLGSMVAQLMCEERPMRVRSLTLPDSPVVTGVSRQVFDHYGLNPEGIAKAALEIVRA